MTVELRFRSGHSVRIARDHDACTALINRWMRLKFEAATHQLDPKADERSIIEFVGVEQVVCLLDVEEISYVEPLPESWG